MTTNHVISQQWNYTAKVGLEFAEAMPDPKTGYRVYPSLLVLQYESLGGDNWQLTFARVEGARVLKDGTAGGKCTVQYLQRPDDDRPALHPDTPDLVRELAQRNLP